MNMKEIEAFLREAYPNASRVAIEIDHLGMAMRVEYAKPGIRRAVWGLDGVEQFPPGSQTTSGAPHE